MREREKTHPNEKKKLKKKKNSSSTKYTDADIGPGKVIYTKLPGSSLKAVLNPTGRGVLIEPASYAGKKVGPAGPGACFFFVESVPPRPPPP